VLEFHRAIEETDIMRLKEAHLECVDREMDKLLAPIRSYCSKRQELGHDLALSELQSLNHELFSLALDCARELDEQREAEFGRYVPESCSDIANSFVAMRKWMLDEGKVSGEDFACTVIDSGRVAAPLEEKCRAGELSLRASTVEYWERMGRACPLPPSD